MFCVQPSYEANGGLHDDFSVFYNFFLTNRSSFLIIDKLNDAAIAQSVERILGKDEVASSNLASSSKASEIFGFQRLTFLKRFWGKKHRRVFDGFSVLFDIFRTFLTDKTGI